MVYIFKMRDKDNVYASKHLTSVCQIRGYRSNTFNNASLSSSFSPEDNSGNHWKPAISTSSILVLPAFAGGYPQAVESHQTATVYQAAEIHAILLVDKSRQVATVGT